ncbi:hypothetical protein J2Z28_005340, partial [Paenibacillus xylanexedens]|nr:hypothetical protein [Paenibacillus xylanexedens]
ALALGSILSPVISPTGDSAHAASGVSGISGGGVSPTVIVTFS